MIVSISVRREPGLEWTDTGTMNATGSSFAEILEMERVANVIVTTVDGSQLKYEVA